MSLQLLSAPRKKSKTASSFLKKTYEMLCDPQNQSSIRWAKNGIGFIVVDEIIFSKEVLPHYFKHSKYSSFVRQLNMYNFHKIRQGNSESYFHHQLFDKNRKQMSNNLRQLLCEIKRKPEKKKRKNGIESQDDSMSMIKLKQTLKQIKLVQSSNNSIKEVKSQEFQKEEKKLFYNTRHVFGSEHENHPTLDKAEERVSIKNILINTENDDDKISINNELADRIPRYPTKQIFYPSNHNLYPFSYGGKMSQFSIFF